MFDIRMKPEIPKIVDWFAEWGMVVIVGALMAVAAIVTVAIGHAGCNTIPDIVCVQMGNPVGCIERLEAAQVEAATTDRTVRLNDWQVIVLPSGQVIDVEKAQ
jgi:hypothetical protein